MGAGEQAVSPPRRTTVPVAPPIVPRDTDVVMTEIESDDVMAMRDQAFGAILDDLNEKQRQTRMSMLLGIVFGLVGMIVGAVVAGEAARLGGVLLGATAFLPGMLIGRWQDSYQRVSVLLYDLEKDAETAYERLGEAFDTLVACGAKWHVASSGQVHDTTTRKRNAGATSLVTRKATVLNHALPSVVRSNVSPPLMQVGRQVLYFMPDVVLVEDGSRFGAVGYAELGLSSQAKRFIEDGSVPRDAEIVDHTWAHPNKNGGPDRRFKDNRQIPVCRYDELHLTSASGLNELVQFSRAGASDAFRRAASAMRPSGSSAPKRSRSPKEGLRIE